MAVYILAHGVLLASLGLFAYWNYPATTKGALITGGVSGALCVIWGVLGLLGHRARIWTGLTLGPTILVMIQQTDYVWVAAGKAQPGSHMAVFVMAVMFLTSVGLMMYVVHCGESAPITAARAKAPEDTVV